jgi:hypothetical protein
MTSSSLLDKLSSSIFRKIGVLLPADRGPLPYGKYLEVLGGKAQHLFDCVVSEQLYNFNTRKISTADYEPAPGLHLQKWACGSWRTEQSEKVRYENAALER